MSDELKDYDHEENGIITENYNMDLNQGMSFNEMNLRAELMAAIAENAFEHPSEVQRECIPQGLLGQDVLCQAKSGSGKTAVFVLVMLQRMSDPKPFSGLVLCNTRELAFQIKKEFERFSKGLGIKAEALYGGVPEKESLEAIAKNPHVLVATPGRLLRMLKLNKLNLGETEFFVLDECDRLLEEVSVRTDVQNIFVRTPFKKQTMMFSATMSEVVKETCRKFLRNKVEVIIDNDCNLTLHGLQQYYVHVAEREKNRKVYDLVKALGFNQLVVFMKSVTRAAELERVLRSNKVNCLSIHAGLSQKQRLERFKEFKENKHNLLIATDVFARGVDIGKINVVLNYDIPTSSDQYLHRVGRAGRFGTKGLTVTFVNPNESSDVQIMDDIQKRFEVKISELPKDIDKTSYMYN